MAGEGGVRPLNVVAVSGTLHRPSKTGLVVEAVLDAVVARLAPEPVATHTIELLDVAGALAGSLAGGETDPALTDAVVRVTDADLLIVATPVYKGGYTGLLKLFVDTLAQDALASRPVLLAATGGSEAHSLVIEHELRPLFGFFRAATVPTGVYAKGADFADGTIASAALLATIDAAAVEAARIVRS